MPPEGRRTKLQPWIEKKIQSYGTEETKTESLKADVIGVGQKSESQAQGEEGPSAMLFLSDGVVQIPAVLTQEAWEALQEQEERECFSSLLNCTVCLRSYSLQFHMAPEQTRCRFFLSVGELITTAAGTTKVNTPCCTTLSSVTMKICKTWSSLLGQDSVLTQNSLGFDLTELLGEWQHDWLQPLLDDVKERLEKLTQPSTSSKPFPPSTHTGTRWAAERVRFTGESFTVPVSHLLIPEELNQWQLTHTDEGSETQSGLVPPPEDRQTDLPLAQGGDTGELITVGDDKMQTEGPVSLERRQPVHEYTLPQESMDGVLVSGVKGGAVLNPWDMFPPVVDLLKTSSASEESITSPLSLNPAPLPGSPAPVPMATSTQVPSDVSGVTQRSEDRALPPYQRPRPSSMLGPSSGSSSSVGPPLQHPDPGTDHHGSPTSTLPTPEQEQEQEHMEAEKEVVQRKYRKAKRKSDKRRAEVASEEEEEEVQRVRSPPSWLFETQGVPRIEEGGSCQHKPAAMAPSAPSRPANVHSDGTLFSYSYQLSGNVSRDLSQFKVPDGMLHWAVRYLVRPKQTDVVRDTQLPPQVHPS